MSALRVTQRRSRNGANKRQLGTLRSLGLRRIGHTVQIEDCEQARGMVDAVRHLVEVHDGQQTPKDASRKAPAAEKAPAAKKAPAANKAPAVKKTPAKAAPTAGKSPPAQKASK
jgi:large subunit ribosomal protein L30